MVGEGIFESCERLPFPLCVCPACGEGIRKSRAPRWIDPSQLFRREYEPACMPMKPGHLHAMCPLCNPRDTKALIIWVGEKHYRVPGSFMDEAKEMGISRKLAHIPTGFEIGRHGVFLAHRRAITQPNDERLPGVFSWFKPQRIDLVVDDPDFNVGREIPDRAKRLKDQFGDNARIVVVEKIPEGQPESSVA